MKIISVDKNNWRASLAEVVKALKNGAIIVYPTETAYGIGGDPKNKKVISKINKLKGRPAHKFLPCIASSYYAVQKAFYLNNSERAYISKNWPGPYTLLLRPKQRRHQLQFGYDDIAIRVSAHECARYLARSLGGFIISTSANLSGFGNNYSVLDVAKQFQGKKLQPDYLIDWGGLPRRKSSTIVKFEGNTKIKIR